MMKDDLDCFCGVERVCSQCVIVRQKKKKKEKTKVAYVGSEASLIPRGSSKQKARTHTPQFSTDGQD